MAERFILACDFSLCSTGLCVLYADGSHKETTVETQAKDWPPDLGRFARYAHIAQKVLDFVPSGVPAGIFIEGYSFGSKGAAVVNIGELGGIMRQRLMSVFGGVPTWEISPNTLKLWATGRGNADKAAMAVAASRRFDFEHRSNDVIDAFLLAQLGACMVLGQEPVTDFQRRAIETILHGKPKKARKSA